MDLSNFVPSVDWIKNYNRDWLKGDISAGLTVGVMLIPQGMAYAMLAGLPPINGLYAVTLPLAIYAILGTSRQLAVGPVAMVSLLTATGVGAIAEVGTEAFLTLAIALSLIVGVIQLALGLFRLGFLVNLLSHPVISGFTSAAALIIGLSQLKHLLGISLQRSHHVHEILLAAAERVSETNVYTLGIGLLGVALIIGAKRVNKAIPGPLLAVVFGILAVVLMNLEGQGVKIVGEVPSGLPSLSFPSFSWAQIQALIPTALTISLVGFMESIAVAKAVHKKHKDYEVVPNKELIALGLANLGGAVVQAYPVTGGFSRTAVNDQAGAKTGLASLISAGLIVLTLLFLTPLFYSLPQAILASVIMVAVFGLIDWKEAKHLWFVHRSDFWMLTTTFFATLTLGIEQGIGAGVLLSIAVHIYRSMRPHLAVLGKIPGTDAFRNVDRFTNAEEVPETLIVRFDGQLYFANLSYFQAQLNALVEEKKELKTVIINAEGISAVDSSAMHEVHNFVETQHSKGINVVFAGLIGPVRDLFTKDGLISLIGPSNFYLSVPDAVKGASITQQNTSDHAIQANE
ncbi:MAG: solute carrier family 26 protein [Lewinella sp.]|nr:solute carrier family 26 protein [Lewinella sp.]